jgi:hypothetical protein
MKATRPSRLIRAGLAGALAGLALLPLSAAPGTVPRTSWCDEIALGGRTPATPAHFGRLLDEVAAGWNHGDARRSAACFTEDALYSSAGDSTARRGRAVLYQFFGGDRGRPAPMFMTWHHRAFDAGTQVGFGEYTFRYAGHQGHGVTVVQLRRGRIAGWREYEVASSSSWTGFTRANPF